VVHSALLRTNGMPDLIGTLSEYCTSFRVQHASRVILNAAMERLPELTELGIQIRLEREGTELTSIIGQSKTME
jgi:hypothetical protein